MSPAAIQIAERVIRTADRQHPADRVLREKLKSERRLPPEEATAISRGVFAYYRWLGWLDRDQSLSESIRKANEMARQFAHDPASFSDEELLRRGVPEWLANEMEVTPALVRAFQREPVLWLRARPGTAEALAAKLPGARRFRHGLLSDALQYHGNQNLFLTPEFHAGEFEIQDLNSQAVAVLCAAQPGETWWDACAGEGGKTIHLSHLMNNKGLIWASDIAEWRLAKLRKRTARAKVFNYRSAVWDGSTGLPTKTQFNGVLVDATCTAMGTWHRNPHAKWTTRLDDLLELSEVQRTLLSHASKAVKPGGKIVYAVCSLARSETDAVADAFERTHSNFKPTVMPHPFGREPGARLRLLPQDHGGNGMFIATWTER